MTLQRFQKNVGQGKEKGGKNMRILCEIGGLALAGLLILFLVIDIAIIRVGKIAEKRDNPGCHRTIREKNKMNTSQQTAAEQNQGSVSAGGKAGI